MFSQSEAEILPVVVNAAAAGNGIQIEMVQVQMPKSPPQTRACQKTAAAKWRQSQTAPQASVSHYSRATYRGQSQLQKVTQRLLYLLFQIVSTLATRLEQVFQSQHRIFA